MKNLKSIEFINFLFCDTEPECYPTETSQVNDTDVVIEYFGENNRKPVVLIINDSEDGIYDKDLICNSFVKTGYQVIYPRLTVNANNNQNLLEYFYDLSATFKHLNEIGKFKNIITFNYEGIITLYTLGIENIFSNVESIFLIDSQKFMNRIFLHDKTRVNEVFYRYYESLSDVICSNIKLFFLNQIDEEIVEKIFENSKHSEEIGNKNNIEVYFSELVESGFFKNCRNTDLQKDDVNELIDIFGSFFNTIK